MIQLEEKDYDKITALLHSVPINTLFAKAVLQKTMPGRVYVDDTVRPSTILISHNYGMSLLFGETGNERFNAVLTDYMLNNGKVRGRHEWLQAYPDEWSGKIERLLGANLNKKDAAVKTVDIEHKVMENTRVNFTFDRERFEKAFKQFDTEEYCIVRTTKEIYQGLKGSVLPQYFWRDADQFLADGIGFSLMIDGEAASTAFAAFILDGQLELGIETMEKHRGRGYAQYVCAALIQHCIERGLEPVWACRLENTASYNLAQRMGFTPSRLIPYYCLPV